jgi:hypothetical protein
MSMRYIPLIRQFRFLSGSSGVDSFSIFAPFPQGGEEIWELNGSDHQRDDVNYVMG